MYFVISDPDRIPFFSSRFIQSLGSSYRNRKNELLDFLVDLPQLLFQVVRDMVISLISAFLFHETRKIVTPL